ncbi:hypothetical protein D3C71_1672610 [compost metagenome]
MWAKKKPRAGLTGDQSAKKATGSAALGEKFPFRWSWSEYSMTVEYARFPDWVVLNWRGVGSYEKFMS